METSQIQGVVDRLKAEVRKAVVRAGRGHGLMLVSLSDGHILLEGVPGTAKTRWYRPSPLQCRCILDVSTTPISCQATSSAPNLFKLPDNAFQLVKGPGSSPRYRWPTDGGHRLRLSRLAAGHARTPGDDRWNDVRPGFRLHGDRDPEPDRKQHLPVAEAQLDRFRSSVALGYPSCDEEVAILSHHGHRSAMPRPADGRSRRSHYWPGSDQCRQYGSGLRLTGDVTYAIVDLIRYRANTCRCNSAHLPAPRTYGGSRRLPRAAIDGRDYVIPDDVKRLARIDVAPSPAFRQVPRSKGHTVEQVIIRSSINRPRRDEHIDMIAPPLHVILWLRRCRSCIGRLAARRRQPRIARCEYRAQHESALYRSVEPVAATYIGEAGAEHHRAAAACSITTFW